MAEKTYTAKEIGKMIKLFCCHVSGMHDPEHFGKRKYVCNDQKAKALERLCVELGINPKTKSDPDCGWCEDYPAERKGKGLPLLKK